MIELEIIYRAVCDAFKVDIKNKSRCTHYVLGRCAFFHYSRRYTNYSLSSVARYVGRHHSTVIYSVSNFERYKFQFPEFDSQFEQLEQGFDLPKIKLKAHEIKGLNFWEIKIKKLERTLLLEQNRRQQISYRFKIFKEKLPAEIVALVETLNKEELETFIDVKLKPHMRAFKYYQKKYKTPKTIEL